MIDFCVTRILLFNPSYLIYIYMYSRENNACILKRKQNKFSLFFFLACATLARRAWLERDARTDPLSDPPRFSSPKILDWLSNVGTTTIKLRNYVRYSTWSLIELSSDFAYHFVLN